jgi:hypothetical protein
MYGHLINAHVNVLKVSSLLGYYGFLPANAIRFIIKRQRCAITTNCSAHRSSNLNELSNSRSSITQDINHVRSWGSDVIIRWTSYGQLLICCACNPTCHVQVDHSMAHMEGVSYEPARKASARHLKPMESVTYPWYNTTSTVCAFGTIWNETVNLPPFAVIVVEDRTMSVGRWFALSPWRYGGT